MSDSLHITEVLGSLLSDLEFNLDTRKYILRRFSNEGIYFLTTTLPKVGKAVILALETGNLDRSTLTDFAWKDAILLHFYDDLKQIFCVKTGVLLTEPSSECISRIRTLAEFFYKLAIPYEDKLVKKAEESFRANEDLLSSISISAQPWAEILRKDFETYYPTLSRKTAHEVLSEHRPRATNGTYVGCSSDFYLERVSTRRRVVATANKGFRGYFKSYPSMSSSPFKHGKDAKLKEIVEPSYSELLFVPKDSRGPRTICREFRHRVETQMAYFDWMVSNLPLITNGAINFQDQSVNRALAAVGSVNRQWSTLDLKDASDMVSFKLINTIFRNSPACRWFIHGANRAKSVLLPNGEIRKLNKLAGMGSGLTFPTMALLISLTVCREVVNCTNLKYESIRKKIYVYGDDIIVPREWTTYAYRGLAKVGLKVNGNKSFRLGFFRESCGGDYFKGVDVTPLRMKFASSDPYYSSNGRSLKFRKVASSYVQVYELAKQAYQRGYKNLVDTLLGYFPKGFLIPGAIQDDGSFTDFRKGTRHIDPSAQYTVNYPSSGKHRIRYVIDNIPGKLIRDPYYYLSGKISGRSALDGVANRQLDHLYSGHPSRFDELTIPRTILIRTKKVSGDSLLNGDLTAYIAKLKERSNIDRLSKSSIVGMFSFS